MGRKLGNGLNKRTSKLGNGSLDGLALDEVELRQFRANHRRISAVTAAIRNDCDLSGLFKLIRDVVVDDCGFDRAGVFSFDPITETVTGFWGTAPDGTLRDISNRRFVVSDAERCLWQSMLSEGKRYNLRHFGPDDQRPDFDAEMSQVRDHAVILLETAGQVLGTIAIDNLTTCRPISESQIEEIMPFVEQAAMAVWNAKLRQERKELIERQKHVLELTLAITSNEDPDKVFLMIRNTIMEIGFVDRVGVWVAEEHFAQGTWGTDEEGNLKDEHDFRFPIDRSGHVHASFLTGDPPFLIDLKTFEGPNGEQWVDVPHAFIPLRVSGEFIGFVAVDTLLTRRRITPAMVSALLPIADEAAVIIQKTRIQAQRETVVCQQKRMMEIAVEIIENQDSDLVFQMVRDAIMETGWVDRAAVWLIDGDMARGTWGTDNLGRRTDEHDVSFSLAEHCDDFARCVHGSEPFVIDVLNSVTLPNGDEMRSIPHASIPLRAGSHLIGILTVDTLLTMRKITPDKLELILPLANLAAVVVMKRRLLLAAKEEIERRREVESLLIGQTHELIAARDDALAASRAKNQFLSNMSHEIRTPMNGVVGLTSLLKGTSISATQAKYVNGIEKCAEDLLSAIDGILDFSRLEAGTLEIQCHPFNLRETIADVADSISLGKVRDGVKFTYTVSPGLPERLLGDGDRVRQILWNLADNAVKFTLIGEVFIEAMTVAESSEVATVRLIVRDTGVGIAPANLEVVFDSFTQGDGTSTRRYGGTGLGLTITKQIVELMGGTIRLQSILGQGTTVWLDIPFAKP